MQYFKEVRKHMRRCGEKKKKENDVNNLRKMEGMYE